MVRLLSKEYIYSNRPSLGPTAVPRKDFFETRWKLWVGWLKKQVSRVARSFTEASFRLVGGAWIGRVWSREHGRAGLDLIHLNLRLDLQNPKKLVECTLFLEYRFIEYVILDLISRCTEDILGEGQPSDAHKVETNLPSTESTLDHKARRVAERNCQPPANDTSPSHKRRSCNHDGIRS